MALIPEAQNDSGITARAEMENMALSQAEGVVHSTKVVNDIKDVHIIVHVYDHDIICLIFKFYIS